jgi:hypothetical protein
MNIEYTLGKTNSRKYQQLACNKPDTLVKDLRMFGFGDTVNFSKKNNDGSTYGTGWGTNNLSCFSEFKRAYTRLMDMPLQDVKMLAKRMYELLFQGPKGDERYRVAPTIDETKPKYQQMLKELTLLQATQRALSVSGQIVFPEISNEELKWIDHW